MAIPLMPKATAIWLVENTTLTFNQIAEFCGLHPLEVQAIADGEVVAGMVGFDPIANNQLTSEEIKRCSADSKAKLQLMTVDKLKLSKKVAKYTPLARRHDRPDAIAWVLKNHPELSEGQIVRLLQTTKTTIANVREKTHWNTQNIKPRHPVSLGLCNQDDLDEAIRKVSKISE